MVLNIHIAFFAFGRHATTKFLLNEGVSISFCVCFLKKMIKEETNTEKMAIGMEKMTPK